MAENANPGFMLFDNQRRLWAWLNAEQKAALIDALYAYNAGEAVEMTDPIVGMAFDVISASIERVKAFNARQKANGAKGGRPRHAGAGGDQGRPAREDPAPEKAAVTQPNPAKAENGNEDKNENGIEERKGMYSASADAARAQAAPAGLILQGKKKRLSGKRAEAFARFWEAFADKRGKADAIDAWAAIPELSGPLVDRILSAAGRYAEQRGQIKANGGTPKMAQGWIASRRWEDEPEEQGSGGLEAAFARSGNPAPAARTSAAPEPAGPAARPASEQERPKTMAEFLQAHPEHAGNPWARAQA